MPAILQLALDFVDLHRAVRVAERAVPAGVDWVEAGTPLIKSEGLDAVRELKRLFPGKTIVADMKIMDAGRIEVESAAKAGAQIIDVLGTATDATIEECIQAGKNYGAKIAVDLIAVADPVARAQAGGGPGGRLHLGARGHRRADAGPGPLCHPGAVSQAVHVPVGVAGGINSETAAAAVAHGAAYVIVGGAITKALDPAAATQEIRRALDEGVVIPTTLFKRGGEEEIRRVLEMVSAANLSDALHRGGVLEGLRPLAPGMRLVGRALTVRTYPGDWAKPVEAIDLAQPGDVLVVDAGGVGPAIWGELATHSAIQRGLNGVVIDGAIRDSGDIVKLGFPAFSRLVMPNAGEPKGFGEIGVPIRIGNQKIEPGTGSWGTTTG